MTNVTLFIFPSLIRNTLKVIVEGETGVKLFPEQDEPTNILNIKRGIVSALMVPVLEEGKNNNMVRADLFHLLPLGHLGTTWGITPY